MFPAQMTRIWSLGDCHSPFDASTMNGVGWIVKVKHYVFVDSHVQFCTRQTSWKGHKFGGHFPKDTGLICSAEGKLQTPPQMKRKEWMWALITDDRVCCLSALWSQLINIRAGTKCDQNLNRPISLQLWDSCSGHRKRYSDKAQRGKTDIWLLTSLTHISILTEANTLHVCPNLL